MARLGGSPLGLIGLMSTPTSSGMSGFNGGKNSNFDVNRYNSGLPPAKSKSQGAGVSMFTGQRRLRAWPNIKIAAPADPGEEKVLDTTGLSGVYKSTDGSKFIDRFESSRGSSAKGSNKLHNNDVYDTSVLNIIQKLSGTKAALKPQDFAYLKDLGVYPNNRLMVARRFHSPSGDNIMVKSKSKKYSGPMAVLISWVPEGDNFVDITFGEHWTEARADFTGMLNSLGDDFKAKAFGDRLSQFGGAVPLPGFTEIFQRWFLSELGLLESSAANSIPAGNPNLIKEAKVRKTVGYSEAGSGLMAKVSIKMTCEYEMKFISGIDPTIVWMDLLGNIMRFGTSDSSNYGLSQKVAAKISKWANNPYTLIDDVVSGIASAISKAKSDLIAAIKSIWTAATEAAQQLSDGSSSGDGKEKSERDVAMDAANAAYEMGEKLINGLIKLGKKVIVASVMKYRVEVLGIVNALTGNPSTPWHITIGNPMRPVFCSGDMYTQEVQLVLGPTLAFNDLPSNITVTFTLQNARSLGLQEIMAKFNSGYLRTVDTQRSFYETTVVLDDKKGNQREEVGALAFGDLEKFTINDDGRMVGQDQGTINAGGGNDAANNVLGSTNGTKGTMGTDGDRGTNGTNGSNGDQGTTGTRGTGGTNGTEDANGTKGDIDKKVPGGTKEGSPDEKTTNSKVENGSIPLDSKK